MEKGIDDAAGLAGKICCRCGLTLEPSAPDWRSGERKPAPASPRHDDLPAAQPDGVRQRFDVPSDEKLFGIGDRDGAKLDKMGQSITLWNKGSTWLNLTEQQY